MRRLVNSRAPLGLVSALAILGVTAATAQASDLTAYVTNEQAGTISRVDLTTGALGAPIEVGSEPDGIAITPDGSTAYVADFGTSQVVPVTLATGVAGTPIPLGDRPSAIAIAPDGKTAYAISDTGLEWPITLATGQVGSPNMIPTNADALAISSNGTGYVADAADATLRAISLSTGTVSARIGLNSMTPDGMAITPDGASAYFTTNNGGTLAPDLAGHRVALTGTGTGTIVPVSLSSGALGVPIQVGGEATGIAISPDGSTAYVTDLSSNELIPVTLATGALGTPIAVGAQPSAIALVPTAALSTPVAPPAAPPSAPPATPPATPAPSQTPSGSNGATTTIGNQQLTLTVSSTKGATVTMTPKPGATPTATSTKGASDAQVCYRPSATLRFTLTRRMLKHAAKLRFRSAVFTLGKLHKHAKRLPATARFRLRQLKSGTQTVYVKAFFSEQLTAHAAHSNGHKRKLSVTLTKTVKQQFRVC